MVIYCGLSITYIIYIAIYILQVIIKRYTDNMYERLPGGGGYDHNCPEKSPGEGLIIIGS